MPQHAQPPLGNALQPGPLEVVGFNAPLGVGRSGKRRWKTRRGTVWKRCKSRYPLPEAGSQVSKIPAVGESKTTNFNDAHADEVIK